MSDTKLVHEIKDHDHEFEVEILSENESGRTVKYVCTDPECEYWKSEWESDTQKELDEFCR